MTTIVLLQLAIRTATIVSRWTGTVRLLRQASLSLAQGVHRKGSA